MKDLIILQALFDLDQQRKSNHTSFFGKINKIATGYVMEQHTKLKDKLPRANSGYITASIICFLENEDEDFFKHTLLVLPTLVIREVRRTELDTTERKEEV